MLATFKDWIKSDMKTVLQAKGAFILTLILAIAIAWFPIFWIYGILNDALNIKHDGITEAQDIKYDTVVKQFEINTKGLRDNLAFKEGLITEYRERLGLISAKGSEFSRMTHTELKDKTLALVSEMRDFLEKYQEESQSVYDNEWVAMTRASTEQEKRKLWNKFTSTSMRVSNYQRAEYDREFKVDTIILRDELLSRLPKEAKKTRDSFLYEHPTNPIGTGMVANDLERLAKLLK